MAEFGARVRQHRLDVAEALASRPPGQARPVEGGHGRGPALRLHAVQEDGLSLGPEGGDRTGGVVQDEVEIRILLGPGVVDEPYLDVVARSYRRGGNIVDAEPAKRDDGVDMVRRIGEEGDAGEPDVVVVRVSGQGIAVGPEAVVHGRTARPPLLVRLTVTGRHHTELNQFAGPYPRPSVQASSPLGRHRGGSPSCAEKGSGDGGDRVGVPAPANRGFKGAYEMVRPEARI